MKGTLILIGILIFQKSNRLSGWYISLLNRMCFCRSIIVKTKHDALSDTEAHVMKFRDYLLFGHKKEGLEYAMEHGLWGHALFLASKMDERSYSNVMLRFANGLVSRNRHLIHIRINSGFSCVNPMFR